MSELISKILSEIEKTLLTKREDYGPIERTIGRFGLQGVSVRLTDKIERLNRIVWDCHRPNHEGIEDTLKDIVGYAVLGLELLKIKEIGAEEATASASKAQDR